MATKFGYDSSRKRQEAIREAQSVEKMRNILIEDPTRPTFDRREPQMGELDYSKRVSKSNLQSSIDAENIKQLLPDVEKAKQILISTILSPKDLITVNPIFRYDNEFLGEVATELIRVVEKDLEKNYDIKRKMKRHLEDALFDYGAHISVILPKSRIDSIINSDRGYSNETYTAAMQGKLAPANIGILGDPNYYSEYNSRHFSVENLRNTQIDNNVGHANFCLSITDNIDAFKYGEFTKRFQERRIEDIYAYNRGASVENLSGRVSGLAIDQNTVREIQRKKDKPKTPKDIFQTRWYERKLVLDLGADSKEDEAYDIDDVPLDYAIPHEAFIPVHEPSDPSKIIGGFALIDPLTGSPVHRASIRDFYQQMQQGMSPTADSSSQALSRMRSTLLDYGYRSSGAQNDADVMLNMYTGIVVSDIKNRIKNGILGNTAVLSENNEIYRIMFARACQQQQTQLIYIPKRFMTYFCFDYDDRGVGKSLLTASRTMAAIRATTMLSNFFANVRNSTNYRKYTLELDENDPDPDETVETTVHEIAHATQQNTPMFEPNPTDIVNFIQNHGMSIEVTGHPRWAATKVDMQNVQASNITIDTDFTDRLQQDHMAQLGVPAEAVNAAIDTEFMRNIVQNHLLHTKNAMRLQDEYCPQLTDNIRKYLSANGHLLNKLRDIVRDKRDILAKLGVTSANSDNDIVNHFVNNFVVELPAPDLTQLDIQMEEFDKYNEALEKFLPSFISGDILGSDTAMQLGELGGNIDNLTNICRAYLQRKWLSEHGVMPELFELVAETTEDEPAHEVIEQHLIHHEGLVKVLLPMIARLTKRNKRIAKVIEKMDLEGDDDDSESDDETTSDSQSNDGGDGEGSGGDEFDESTSDDSFDDFGTGESDLGGAKMSDEGGGDLGGEGTEPKSDDPTQTTSDEGNAGEDEAASTKEGAEDKEPETPEEPKEPDEDKTKSEFKDTGKDDEDTKKEVDKDLGGFKG